MNDFSFSRSLQDIVDTILSVIPPILGALAILIIGYFVAKGVSKLVAKVLTKLRFDRALHTSSAGNTISRIVESPSKFVGGVVYWLIFLLFISFAVSALNLTLLDQILNGIYSYIPHVIAAIVIFLVASFVSVEATRFVQRVMGKTATARMISAVIPGVTMSLAVFMILNELNVARDIVNILFTAIVGATALGLALAFGLGGRDVARGLLEQAVDSAKQNSGTIKGDLNRASQNAKREAQQAKDKFQQ